MRSSAVVPSNLGKEWSLNKRKHKEEFCRIMFETGLVRFMITETGRGRLAPYFVKLDLLLSFPKEFSRAFDIMFKTIKFEVGVNTFSRIAATTTHVMPYAAILSHTLEVPMLFIETSKTEGRKRRIDGILNPGDKVLIVDDVISTGKTATLATNRLRAEGALVEDFVALLDNEKGGKQNLKNKDVDVHAFITISEVADYLKNMTLISDEEHKLIYKSVRKHAP